MLADLNDMIERRDRGEPYDFEGFMRRQRDLFPDQPSTLEELLEKMARRMAAMSQLMASLTPEQRAELQALAEQVMQDMDLAFEVDRLGANLASMFPDLGWGEPGPPGGRGSDAAVGHGRRDGALSTTTRSSSARRGSGTPAPSIDDVDEDAVRRTLGEDAVRDVRRLKRIERALEEAGLLTRRTASSRSPRRGRGSSASGRS